MQHDETLEDARRMVAIVNATLVAKHHNPRRTAAGLLAVIELLLHNDTVGRISLAALMAEVIVQLLAGVEPELRADAHRQIVDQLLLH
jgi:hypothetical protein